MMSRSAIKSWGKKEKEMFVVLVVVFSCNCYALLPVRYETTSWQWEVVNEFLVLLWLHMQLLLFLLNCLYYDPRKFSPSFYFFSPSPVRGEREKVSVFFWLLAGFHTQFQSSIYKQKFPLEDLNLKTVKIYTCQ